MFVYFEYYNRYLESEKAKILSCQLVFYYSSIEYQLFDDAGSSKITILSVPMPKYVWGFVSCIGKGG
jgi:hypothetical protein